MSDDKAQRKQNVIEILNTARKMELHAIHQYMNQHYNLDDMDYGQPAGNIKLIAIDEMRHAESFAERVKELGGEPSTEMAPITRGQEIHAIFTHDSELEDDTIAQYNKFRQGCLDNGDSLSAELFTTIIAEEQAHYNYFDNEASHIERLGDTYLSKIAGSKGVSVNSRGFIAASNSPE